jgi:hypothetical protein
MKDIQARSYSNDSLKIISGEDYPLVLKTFTSNLDRALLNIDKQKKFVTITNDSFTVRSAPITSIFENKLNIEMTMPYIEGISGEDFAIYGVKKIATHLSLSLSSILSNEFSKSVDISVDKKIFTDKFESIFDFVDDLTIKSFYLKLKKFLCLLPDKLIIPYGPCHGDLTLGNLIYAPDNSITLFDFLYTYYESPLQDVGKLIQEFKYHWSFRQCSDPIKLKGKIFLASAYPKYLDNHLKNYKSQILIFEMLNLIRISPYIRDDITLEWLLLSLNKLSSENHL